MKLAGTAGALRSSLDRALVERLAARFDRIHEDHLLAELLVSARETSQPELFLAAYFQRCAKRISAEANQRVLAVVAMRPFQCKDVAAAVAEQLFQAKQWELARLFAKAELAVAPGNWRMNFIAGVIHVLQRQPQKARRYFLQAAEERPGQVQTEANLASVNALLCDWEHRETRLRRLHQLVDASLGGTEPVHLNPFEGGGITRHPRDTLVAAKAKAAAIQQKNPPLRWNHRVPSGRSRLRVGYLSADFKDHPVSHLLAPVLPLHDRDRFEIFAYAVNGFAADEFGARVRRGVEHPVSLKSLRLKEQAALLASDQLDLLIDLGGYSIAARPDILACRPARRQAHYLGYAATMGADFVDYYLADDVALPVNMEPYFSEKIIRMPDTFMPPGMAYSPPEGRPCKSSFGFGESDIVLCVFNATYKIDPNIFGVWMNLLREVPNAKLWFKFKPVEAMEFLAREARAHGVDPSRLVLATEKLTEKAHMDRLRCADLFLDTPLYNAHATAVMVVKAGLPLLTVAGNTLASRVAASLLTALGCADMIQPNADAYLATAVNLLSNPARLASLRSRFETAAATCADLDPARFIKKLENTLLSVCREN